MFVRAIDQVYPYTIFHNNFLTLFFHQAHIPYDASNKSLRSYFCYRCDVNAGDAKIRSNVSFDRPIGQSANARYLNDPRCAQRQNRRYLAQSADDDKNLD